jgi:tetratricopeptide (TPR) repeat protein
MSYYLAGENDKALQAFITAAKLDPQDKKIYNNMGLALGKLGRYDEALEAFKKAGDEASAYNNLGCVYLAQNKYREAAGAFQKAVELNPKYYEKARENMKYAEASLKREEGAQQQ